MVHTASSAEHMFNSMDVKLAESDIPWQMLSIIGVENTNANIGACNLIKTAVLAKNKDIVIVD